MNPVYEDLHVTWLKGQDDVNFTHCGAVGGNYVVRALTAP